LLVWYYEIKKPAYLNGLFGENKDKESNPTSILTNQIPSPYSE